MSKITLIGLGKAGISNPAKILRTPDLKGCSLSLVGKNEEKIHLVEMFAKQLNQYFDSEMSIQGTTDLEKSLVKTDYIFLSSSGSRKMLEFESRYCFKIRHQSFCGKWWTRCIYPYRT